MKKNEIKILCFYFPFFLILINSMSCDKLFLNNYAVK